MYGWLPACRDGSSRTAWSPGAVVVFNGTLGELHNSPRRQEELAVHNGNVSAGIMDVRRAGGGGRREERRGEERRERAHEKEERREREHMRERRRGEERRGERETERGVSTSAS